MENPILLSRTLRIGLALFVSIGIASCSSMKLEPSESICTALETAENHYRCGMLHYHDGNYAEAITQFSEAIRLDAAYQDAYDMRGLSHRQNGEASAAIDDFSESIRLRPNDSSPYTNRASTYFEIGNLDAALRDYAHAIMLEPTNADTLYNRGLLHEDIENLENAIEDFSIAIRYYAEAASGNFSNVRGWYNPEFYNRKFGANGLRRIDQYLADAYRSRGQAFEEQGRRTEAEADFAAASAILEKDAD